MRLTGDEETMKMMVGLAFAIAAGVALASGKTVKVSDFGWDPVDSTKYIQAALDSDAATVILDRQAGPWMTLPLLARSNKTVIFEPGVELQAKRGAFLAIRDYLFTLDAVTNVTLIGSGGARMKMHKSDYQKPPYPRSEWRYALRIVGSTNVFVKGLSFVESGGDGILVARNSKNVTLLDCICDGNHRQGISVIGAENLLIENCVMRNTSGTPPQAGIDFEPDHSNEPLINCVMRNCVTENNAGDGYQFYLANLTAKTGRLSVLIDNCQSIGDANSVSIGCGPNKDPHDPGAYPKGGIEFRNCRFSMPRFNGISVGSKPAGSVTLSFDACTVEMDSASRGSAVSMLSGSIWDAPPIDDVTFRDFTARLPAGGKSDWAALSRSTIHPASVTNVSGTVRVTQGSKADRVVVLDDAWRNANLKPSTDKPLPRRYLPDGDAWRAAIVHDACPGKPVELSRVWIPPNAVQTHYVFFAPRKGDIKFAGRTRKVRNEALAADLVNGIRVMRLNRRGTVFTCDAPGAETAEFTVSVPSAGYYELHPSIGNGFHFMLERAEAPVAIDTRQKHAVLHADGMSPVRLWLSPNANDEFFVYARGGIYSGSTALASICRGDGTVVASGVGSANWTGLAATSQSDSLLLVEMSKVEGRPFSFLAIDAAGTAGLFFLSPEKTWAFAAPVRFEHANAPSSKIRTICRLTVLN